MSDQHTTIKDAVAAVLAAATPADVAAGKAAYQRAAGVTPGGKPDIAWDSLGDTTRAGWIEAHAPLAGVVAAAPPGDEDDDPTEAVLDMAGAVLLTDAPLSVRAAAQRVAVLIEVDGWRLAPPTGHEDEAAVERAARAMFEHDHIGVGRPWDADGTAARLTRKTYRERARAALAAARGPRPVEDEAAVERTEEPVPAVTVCGPPVGCTCPAVAWTCICGARKARTSNPTEETR